MEINQSNLIAFRKDFQEALKGLEEKYGVIIQSQKITYESDRFHFKVEVKNGTSKEDVNQIDFNKYCKLYGLQPEDYLRTFAVQGEQYQIVGINPAKRKKTIIIKKLSNGLEYICAAEQIPFVRAKAYSHPTHSTHTCKYCGKRTEGSDEDLLCPTCREMFGHALYSEL